MTQYLITQRHKLLGELRDQAWVLYADSFAELNKHTAQNHMMKREQFNDMCDDERIVKHIATGSAATVLGFAVMIEGSNLDAWPLASIPYLETHWSEYFPYRLWYLGFICAEETKRKSGIFRQMLEVLSAPARVDGGVVFADFAEVNQHLPRGSYEQNKTIDPKTWFKRVDWQGYYAFGFSGGA